MSHEKRTRCCPGYFKGGIHDIICKTAPAGEKAMRNPTNKIILIMILMLSCMIFQTGCTRTSAEKVIHDEAFGGIYIDISIDDFTGIALYSDIEKAGCLNTGDEKINKLLSNISWGQKSNFIDVPTDCPQRDERMGWTADTQVFVPTASYLTDSYAFYKKYMYDLNMEQKSHGGVVPNVIPSFGVKDCSSVWGDAATIVPWSLYLYYGDKGILKDSLEGMVSWVDYIRFVDGDDHGWRKHFHFGDWLALDHPGQRQDQTAGGTDEGYIADIYYMFSAELTAKAACILGQKEVYEEYHKLSEEIRQSIKDEYFTKSGRCAIPTQTGYTLALLHDLTDARKETISQLLKLLKAGGNKLRTGFVGTPLILGALSDLGQDRLRFAWHCLKAAMSR